MSMIRSQSEDGVLLVETCHFDLLPDDIVLCILYQLFPWDGVLFPKEIHALLALRLVSQRFCERCVATILASMQSLHDWVAERMPSEVMMRYCIGLRSLLLDSESDARADFLPFLSHLDTLIVSDIPYSCTSDSLMTAIPTCLNRLALISVCDNYEVMSCVALRCGSSLEALTINGVRDCDDDIHLPSGLKHLALTHLHGYDVDIDLSRLTALVSLDIHGGPWVDVTPLAGTLVHFVPHWVTDTQTVLALTCLEELDLRFNTQISIECLSRLSRLHSLSVDHCEERLWNRREYCIMAILALTRLRRLSFTVTSNWLSSSLEDLTRLTGLTQLALLNARHALG